MLTLGRSPVQRGHRLVRLARLYASEAGADVEPPMRRHRDAVSVLRALNSCVKPVPGLPDYRCLSEPWLGSCTMMRTSIQSKVAGRNSARYVARHFLPNDFSALVSEIPRIDAMMPLQSGESVRKELEDGKISASETMDRLLLLLSPKEAWKLYVDTNSTDAWSSDQLHRLLDLLCATNSGEGGINFFDGLSFVDRGNYADPDELFFAEENRVYTGATSDARRNKANLATSEEDTENPDDADADGAVNSSNWLPNGPAEKLWTEQADVLRSSAAYNSIIRGAAGFGNAQRAWTLAEEIGLSSLSLPALHSLLRCAPSIKVPDVWPHVVRVLEVITKPTTDTFSCALFALSKRPDEKGIVAKALGLMKEARSLGITPNLGMHANMIQIVLESPPEAANRVGNTLCYRTTELLSDIIVEVEKSWTTNPPSRTDVFTRDDYNFFYVAMVCAMNESKMNLAQRIYDLVNTVDGDKRFLFSGSFQVRKFYSRYCAMALRFGRPFDASAMEKASYVADLYRKHRQYVLAKMTLLDKFVLKLKTPIAAWRTRFEQHAANAPIPQSPPNEEKDRQKEEPMEHLEQANSIAFTALGDILIDYAAIQNRMPKRFADPIVDAVLTFSNCDPWVSVTAPNGDRIRLISLQGAENAGKVANALLNVARKEEMRGTKDPVKVILPPVIVTGLIKMALMVTAFSACASPDVRDLPVEETVHQRELNERALSAALDLLFYGHRNGIRSDIGALETIRSLWFIDGEMSDRLWSVLEYLSGLNYFSGRFINHTFTTEFLKILEATQKDLQASSDAFSSFNQQFTGQMVSGRTETDTNLFKRLCILRALITRISEARKSTTSKP